MKTTHIILTILNLLTLLSTGRADQTESFFQSKPEQDIIIIIAGIDKLALTNSKVAPRADEMLLFGICSVTNPDCIVYWSRAVQSFCTVELLDSMGQPMGKTVKGKEFQLSESVFAGNERSLVRQHARPAGPGQSPVWQLFKTDDLFEMPAKGGNFTLKLNFQVQKVEFSGTNAYTKVVGLPTIVIPISDPGRLKLNSPRQP